MQPSQNKIDREFSHSRKPVEQELEDFYTLRRQAPIPTEALHS